MKELFPIVSVKGNELISIKGDKSYFYKVNVADFEQLDNFELTALYNRVTKTLNNLDDKSFFKFYQLDGQIYLNCSHKLTSFSEFELIEQSEPLKVFLGYKQLYSDIKFFDDYLLYNGLFSRILSVVEFSNNPASNLLLDDELNYVIAFKKISREKSISRLERIRTGHLSGFFKSKRDISSEGAYAQAENILEELLHAQESLFEMELFFLVKAYSLKELNELTNSVAAKLSSAGIKCFIEGQSLVKKRVGLPSIFSELMPGVSPTFKLRGLPDKTTHLQYLLPLSSSYLNGGGVQFFDIKDRQLHFDIFSSKFKNRNMLVSGMSGTGKSVFVNRLVHHLIKDHPAVILDMGGSYKRLSLYHGGVELKASFNPLHFRDPIYLRELILCVTDTKDFDRLTRGKLLAAIKKALPQATSFFELLALLEKSFSGISYYFEEIREFISDEPLQQTRLLYVDIENLPRAIIAPIIIYVLEYFNRIREQEKILVFDECWEYLKEHADFVSRCFRTFRKTGAFPIAISQSLSDFSSKSGELYSAITNNSYFSVLFPQEVTVEQLSEFDIGRINSLEFEKGRFSECYLKSKDSSIRKILRNYLTPLELELAHTESGKDVPLLQFLQQLGQFFNSTPEAINAFVRLKYEDTTYLSFLSDIAATKSINATAT